jgi:hypothetical protein
MPFDEIPRAQGPFRLGQDNREPIYGNSRVKIGADVLDTTTGITLEERVRRRKKDQNTKTAK